MALNAQKFSPDEFRLRSTEPIAKGGFSKVYDGWHERHDRVAIKMLNTEVSLGCVNQQCSPDIAYAQALERRQLRHKALERRQLRHGSQPKVKIPKHLAYRILFEACKTLEKLHSIERNRRLLHLDLKPSNMMLDRDLHVIVADFGAANVVSITRSGNLANRKDRKVHTLCYTAPEFLGGDALPRTSKYDVYSFGITMWEVLTCDYKPFEGYNREQLKDAVLSGQRPSVKLISTEVHGHDNAETLRKLIKDAWHQEPDSRPRFSDILKTLRRLSTASSEKDIDAAVYQVKTELLRLKRRNSLAVVPDEYKVEFNSVINSIDDNDPQVVPPNQHAVPEMHQPILGRPVGDASLASAAELIEGDRPLTNEDILHVANKLYYFDGIEMFAHRIGIHPATIQNINNDCRTTFSKKVAILRNWSRVNGGRPSVSQLIQVLRREKVAVDCWEFLDPDKLLRLQCDDLIKDN